MSVFAHIVESGSISAAAEILGLSKSVLSQHLKALEADLGITLLRRTTRRQLLTDEGSRFYLSCKEINHIAESAWHSAQKRLAEPQGRVRITAPNALMETLVTPVIGELMEKYALLKPELISSDQHLDFHEHHIDLAIRVGTSKNSNLIQRRIGEFRDLLCGTHTTVSGQPIEMLTYISNTWQGKQISHQFKRKSCPDIIYQKEAGCMTNSFHSSLSLIKSGVGIGLVPDFYLPLIKPALVTLFDEYDLPVNTVYALNPYGKSAPLSVEVCTEAIQKQLSLLTKGEGK